MKLIKPADAKATLRAAGSILPLEQKVLLESIVAFNVRLAIVYPGSNVPAIPRRTVCIVDDGSLTRQVMGLSNNGPNGFARDSLDALLRSAGSIILNGGEEHPSLTATIAKAASERGRGVLIETEPKNFLAWVERLKSLLWLGPDQGWGSNRSVTFVVPDGTEMPILPPVKDFGRMKPVEDGPPGPNDYQVVVREWPSAHVPPAAE